jgi:hypothetical protein
MTYSRNMVWDNMAGSRFSCQWRAERIRLLIVHALPDRFDSGRFWEGRRLMRTAARICLMLMAGALAGCQSTNGVQFVASNPDSVLLDYAANPPSNLTAAGDTATQQCQIFNRRIAVLESLNVRDQGVIRATYLCRNNIATASAAPDVMRRRQ